MRRSLAIALYFVSLSCLGQEVLPATSEDVSAFDNMIDQQKEHQSPKDRYEAKSHGSSFAAEIKGETRRLKDHKEKYSNRDFKKWVKSEKNNDSENRRGRNRSGHEGSSERSREDKEDHSGPG